MLPPKDEERRKLAREATPGPWHLQNDGWTIRASRDESSEIRGYRVATTVDFGSGNVGAEVANAAFIAAHNPAWALKMCERLDAARHFAKLIQQGDAPIHQLQRLATSFLAADDKASEES
jgi:hypothetical protein